MPPMLDMNSSFGIEPCISRRTSWRKDMVVARPATLFEEPSAYWEPAPDQPQGAGDQADLFARAPFKTTGWASYEKHRQHQQRSCEKREKKRSPKTHPAMGAAKCGKQAGDNVTENGCCHDLTATS
jgi:hypothetical protein